MNSIIDVKNLKKYYGKVLALDSVNLSVNAGDCFALVGPNGAGKTTLLKCILGLCQYKDGEILLNQVSAKNSQSRKLLSYLPEKFSFHSFYTVEATLRFFGKMHGLDSQVISEKVSINLQRVGISQLADRKMNQLSKGQMQRVGIASTLMGDSNFILLDEPFSGLDPIGIKELKDLILELKKQGITFFINSHILSEIEKMCDSYAIMNNGQIVETGDFSKVSNFEDHFYKLIKGAQ